MTDLTLYLTRPEVGSIIAGGVDRLSFSFTKPFIEEYEDDFAAALFGRNNYRASRWTSKSFMGTFRALRKTGCEQITSAAWNALCDTCFAGIEHEQWEPEFGQEHPDAVPANQWIGEVPLLLSASPVEGYEKLTLTLTGPYDDYRNRWRGVEPFSEETEPVDVWWNTPRLNDFADEEIFTGVKMRPFWSPPGMSGSPKQPLSLLLSVLPQAIGDTLSEAAAGFPTSQEDARLPELTWSKTVELWIRPEHPSPITKD